MRRILTASALIPPVVYLIFWAPDWLFVLTSAAVGLLCYSEFAELVANHMIRHPGPFGIAGGLLLLFWPDYALIELFGILVLACIFALRDSRLPEILPYAAAILLSSIYAFLPWRIAIDLRNESVHLLFFSLALNWVGDSAAYYVGRTFGKHKLAPEISPNKSWEGAMASVVSSLVFGLLYLGHFLATAPWWEIVILAVAGNIAGQFGDLTESAIKRGARVKDSGYILPGHGGMLDRVDSSLFTVPVVYGLHLAIRMLST
jgi:phosphatidate cytidylyltransferase